MDSGLSVIIPAFNEAGAIAQTLQDLKKALQSIDGPAEIIVVDDGSSDDSSSIAASAGARVIRHPMNCGYGRSLLTGIEAARFNSVAIVDADGTYPVDHLTKLWDFYKQGFHMAVAARQGRHYHSSIGKSLLRTLFKFLAEFTCGRKIPDINSGFRIFERRAVLKWKDSVSTGFSFTTTVTLLFMLNNLLVGYLPIPYNKRVGQSKVRLFRDSLRSLQIILTTIAQFNPLKLFLLVAIMNGVGNGLWIALAAYFQWSGVEALLVGLAWNTLGVIISCAIIAVGWLKPSTLD